MLSALQIDVWIKVLNLNQILAFKNINFGNKDQFDTFNNFGN